VKLKFAQRALNEIERGKREWLAGRDKNPELFESELAEALENIKAVPALGSPTDIVSRGQLVRRVEMHKTKYQVYYRLHNDELVYIVSVWGGQRGTKPKLR
jgi:plasmid stabilization system protein ParE